MNDTDTSERTSELKQIITGELRQRGDVKGYEFAHTPGPGVHLIIEQDDATRHYHVRLERYPDGKKRTNWSYLGSDKSD